MMGAQEWLWIGHWCYRCFWGCWGVDLGGSVLVMSVSGVVISGYGWLWGVFGWLRVVMGVSRLSLRHSLNDQGQEKTDHSAQ